MEEKNIDELITNLEEAHSHWKILKRENQKKNLKKAIIEVRKIFVQIQKSFPIIENRANYLPKNQKLTYGLNYLKKELHIIYNDFLQLNKHFSDSSEINKKNEELHEEVNDIILRIKRSLIWELKTLKKGEKNKEKSDSNTSTIKKAQEEAIKLIKEADKEIFKIIKKFDLDDPVNFLKITNLNSEKSKFLERYHELEKGINKTPYNPHFFYKKNSNILSKVDNYNEDIMFKLRKIDIDIASGAQSFEEKNKKLTGAGYIVKKKIFNLQIILKLIRSIGTKDITKYSIQLYGFPTKSTISECFYKLHKQQNITKHIIEQKNEKRIHSAKEFKKQAERFFKEKKIDWTVIITTPEEYSDLSGQYKTLNSEKKLLINKLGEPFSQKNITKGLVHEIGVHAINNSLGLGGPLRGTLAFGTSGYLPTEEGIAKYYEIINKVTMKRFEDKKYRYVVIAHTALKRGFYNCFKILVENGTSEEEAWAEVVRIKRGLSDTSKPGGFMKDCVYYSGDKILSIWIKNGGKPEELQKYGKISISDLDSLKEQYDIYKYLD